MREPGDEAAMAEGSNDRPRNSARANEPGGLGRGSVELHGAVGNPRQLEVAEPQAVDTVQRCDSLDIGQTSVTDLSPLAGWPKLERLTLGANGGPIDLSPLEGLPIWELSAESCGISDISVLASFPTPRYLDLSNNQITDISALEGVDWWLEEGQCADLNLLDNPLSPMSLALVPQLCSTTHVHVLTSDLETSCEGGQTCIQP